MSEFLVERPERVPAIADQAIFGRINEQMSSRKIVHWGAFLLVPFLGHARKGTKHA